MDLKMLLGVIKKIGTSKNSNQSNDDYINGLKDINQLNQINSIKGQARKSIAQYPVLISETVGTQIAPVINHSLEMTYAYLLAMVIQNTDSFNSGGADSVLDKVHRESTFMPGADCINDLYEANKDLLKPYEEQFNMRTLNESYYTKDMMIYFNEASKSDENRKAQEHRWKSEDRDYNRQRDAEKDKRDAEDRDYKRQRDAEKDKRDRDSYESDKKRPGANVLTQPKDIAKMNDMQPTVLNIEVSFRDPKANSDAVITKKISIGVKCVSHLVKADDVEYYLTKAAYKNNMFLKLIKLTTGEIKFWKDFIFAMDEIKTRAKVNTRDKKNDYFMDQEFIAKNAKKLLVAGCPKSDLPSAITTLVISKTDVDNIKYKEGIDIMKDPSTIKKIFNAYYLLNFLVVDEALEVVYVYDVETNTMESKSFKSFEEASKKREINSNDLFKILK